MTVRSVLYIVHACSTSMCLFVCASQKGQPPGTSWARDRSAASGRTRHRPVRPRSCRTSSTSPEGTSQPCARTRLALQAFRGKAWGESAASHHSRRRPIRRLQVYRPMCNTSEECLRMLILGALGKVLIIRVRMGESSWYTHGGALPIG